MPCRATWGDVRRFCDRQNFTLIQTHHDNYEKEISPGLTARTRISHGQSDADPVQVNLWKRAWHEQLRLRSEEDFWLGVEGNPFAFDIPPTPMPAEPLPRYLLDRLTDRLHLSADEAATVSREEAQRMFNDWCSRNL